MQCFYLKISTGHLVWEFPSSYTLFDAEFREKFFCAAASIVTGFVREFSKKLVGGISPVHENGAFHGPIRIGLNWVAMLLAGI